MFLATGNQDDFLRVLGRPRGQVAPIALISLVKLAQISRNGQLKTGTSLDIYLRIERNKMLRIFQLRGPLPQFSLAIAAQVTGSSGHIQPLKG